MLQPTIYIPSRLTRLLPLSGPVQPGLLSSLDELVGLANTRQLSRGELCWLCRTGKPWPLFALAS